MATRDTEICLPVAEIDPRFKSGRYRGFYLQGAQRSAQEMTLSFAEGVVTGWGTDPVGRFQVAGSYDADGGRATWTKSYPGRHTVHYDVTAELKNGLWGLWQIRGFFGDRGGFQLWPVDGRGEGRERELEAAPPVEGVVVRVETAGVA
jgi:hypothetical protein